MNDASPHTPGNTKEALMRAAERLFGTHGLEGTSLRRIGVEAGQANVSAVQYYFRSKEDLVYEILDWRVAQMEPERGDRLAAALAVPHGEVRLFELVKALYFPIVAFTDAAGRHPFARFLAEYMTTFRQKGIRHPEDVTGRTPNLAGIVQELEKELYYLPRGLVRMRTTYGMTGFLALVTQHDGETPHLGWKPELSQLLEDCVRISVAALSAPPSVALVRAQ